MTLGRLAAGILVLLMGNAVFMDDNADDHDQCLNPKTLSFTELGPQRVNIAPGDGADRLQIDDDADRCPERRYFCADV